LVALCNPKKQDGKEDTDSYGAGNQSHKTGGILEEMEVHQDQIEVVYTQEAKEETKEALDMAAQDVVDVDAQGIVSLAA
jgi:hypothetical protein